MSNNDKRIMTLKELAKYLRVNPLTIKKLLKRDRPDRLPGFKIGSDWRFDRQQIDAWMEEQARAAKSSLRGGARPKLRPSSTARASRAPAQQRAGTDNLCAGMTTRPGEDDKGD